MKSTNAMPEAAGRVPFAADMRGRVAPVVLSGLTLFALFYQRSVITVALPGIMKSLHIGAAAAGALVSFQLAGYALLPPLGGYLADRWGAKIMMGATLIGGSLFSLTSGLSSTFGALAASRFLFGASQGADIPSYQKVVATWYADRRGFGEGLTSIAASVGQGAALAVSGAVISGLGLLAGFWAAAIPGVIVAILVLVYLRNHPAEAPPPQRAEVVQQMTFRDFMKSRVAWMLVIIYVVFNIGFWGYVAWVPTYLVTARHFSLVHSGLYASLGFGAGALGAFLFGVLADTLGSRRLVIVGGYIIGALALMVAFYSGSAGVSVAALTVVGFCLLGSLSPLYAFVMDAASPETVGRAFGILQFFGIGGGFIAPILIGWMVASTHSFAAGFWFMIVALLVAALFAALAAPRRGLTAGAQAGR